MFGAHFKPCKFGDCPNPGRWQYSWCCTSHGLFLIAFQLWDEGPIADGWTLVGEGDELALAPVEEGK